MAVWASGVWASGVWADNVWFGMGGGDPEPPAAVATPTTVVGGGRKIRRVEAVWPWRRDEFFFTDAKPKPKKKVYVIEQAPVDAGLIRDEPIRAIFPEVEPLRIQIPKFEYRPRKNDDDEVLLLL